MFNSLTDVSELPAPDEQALRQSARLVQAIRTSITAGGAPISLGQYVHFALYESGLGYYAAGARKFGEHGDFVTAPELGSVFAQCMARGIQRVFSELDHQNLGHASVVELGAGSGQFAYDCLQALQALDAVPARYQILEVSADLRMRQQELLATLPRNLYERVEWLEAPPQQDFEGVVLANEVIDALPMERFCVRSDGQIVMEFVDVDDVGLRSVSRQATPAVAYAVTQLRARFDGGSTKGTTEQSSGSESWSLPYVGEVRIGVGGWFQTVTAHLTRGAVLMVDYGTDGHELYRSDRSTGTLLCHYRHRAHDHVLLWPGLQDITSWVDFSQVADAATQLGWDLNGYTTQAHLLIDFELDDVVATRFANADINTQLRLASEVKRLTLPGEMGERFKAIALSRGLAQGPLTPVHTSLARRL